MAVSKTVNAMEIGSTLRNAFPFHVVKGELTGPQGIKTPHFGLFRVANDTGKMLDCVGNAVRGRYNVHQVDEIITMAEAAAGAFGTEIGINTYWDHGHKLTIAPTDEYRRNIFGTKDDIFPRLIISAGYKGTCFNASLGMYRDICRNLSIPRVQGGTVHASIKHTAQMNYKLDFITLEFKRLVSQWDVVCEAMKDLDRKRCEISSFLDRVFETASLQGKTPKAINSIKARAHSIVSRILRERLAIHGDYGDTTTASAWELFNGVQGYMQWDARKKGSPSNIARAFDAIDNATVARAMEIAIAI
jgi:hypothetical protein